MVQVEDRDTERVPQALRALPRYTSAVVSHCVMRMLRRGSVPSKAPTMRRNQKPRALVPGPTSGQEDQRAPVLVSPIRPPAYAVGQAIGLAGKGVP